MHVDIIVEDGCMYIVFCMNYYQFLLLKDQVCEDRRKVC